MKLLPTIGAATLTGIGMGVGFKFVDWLINSMNKEAEMTTQGAREERGEGTLITGTSISELGSALNLMEDSLVVGERAKLELATYGLPSKDDLDTMWAEMVTSGFHVTRPTARVVDGVPVTSMVLTKGSPMWAALIPLLVPIGVIGLVAFGLVKIEAISKAILPIVLATGGLLIIALGIMRQPAARAAELATAKYLR